MGFGHGSYNISEDVGSIEVCAQVKGGVPQSLLQLSFTTMDGTATGNLHCTGADTGFVKGGGGGGGGGTIYYTLPEAEQCILKPLVNQQLVR